MMNNQSNKPKMCKIYHHRYCLLIWCCLYFYCTPSVSVCSAFFVPTDERRSRRQKCCDHRERRKLISSPITLQTILGIRGGTFTNNDDPITSMNLFRSAVARAGIQSASIMTIADIATQLIVEKRSLVQGGGGNSNDGNKSTMRYDPTRTLRWTVIGLTLHGPYFYLSFGKLDGIFGAATNLLIVAKKTAFAQFVLFPPYLVALFTYMGLMEGSDNIISKILDRVPKAFMSGCIFWPIANVINFSFVPANARVPYLATVGALWNGYLSYMNAKK